jgi:RNA 3'-phosphate cyclase
MIEIDGAFKEGGGQILRTALALSTLTDKPFKIINIRKNRPKPGLKNQHLFCIKALQQISNSKVKNNFPGSTSIEYYPEKITKSKINIDIKTAGSITLLLQSILLPCIFSNTKNKFNIEITGGTDVSFSPQLDYLKEIILPYFQQYTKSIELKLIKRGYFPKGNGKIQLIIKPEYNTEELNKAPKLNLTNQGKLIQIKGISHASLDLQKSDVAKRQAESAKLALSKFKVPINIETSYSDTNSTGSGITIWAIFSKDVQPGFSNQIKIGSDELGQKGTSAENIGIKAANNLKNEINLNAPVDKHLADNLIPLMGLIKNCKIKTSQITNHTKTNIYVTNLFIKTNFNIQEKLIENK